MLWLSFVSDQKLHNSLNMLWSSESRIDLQRLQIYAPFHLGLPSYRAVGIGGLIAPPLSFWKIS